MLAWSTSPSCSTNSRRPDVDAATAAAALAVAANRPSGEPHAAVVHSPCSVAGFDSPAAPGCALRDPAAARAVLLELGAQDAHELAGHAPSELLGTLGENHHERPALPNDADAVGYAGGKRLLGRARRRDGEDEQKRGDQACHAPLMPRPAMPPGASLHPIRGSPRAPA